MYIFSKNDSMWFSKLTLFSHMHSNMIFRINLILKTCNYICYNYVASFLHVLNVISIPANLAIKDLIMFFKSNWISKSTLYLSQVVWEADETICKKSMCLYTLNWEIWKILKHFVYWCHIFFESNLVLKANTMFIT